MFLNKSDLDEDDIDDVGRGDMVTPISMTAQAPQVLGATTRTSSDKSVGAARSTQYQERLNRARQQKSLSQQRRGQNNGMVVSNLAGMPNSRPGTASGNAPTIDVLSQEVEEMELHEQSERENEAQVIQQPAASSARPVVTAGVEQSFEPAVDIAPQRSIAHTPAHIDTTDLRAFLTRPGPEGAMVQCYIQRRKSGMARLFPTYEIYLKDGDQFLLAARKRKKNKSSNYLISLDKDDLTRQSENFFGKLRSNFLGTEFSLYDKGANPEKLEQSQRDSSGVEVRQELGTILFKQNVLGSRGPRKMKVMVPNVNEAGQRKILRPQSSEETMLERYKAAKNDDDVQILKNKPPKWNEQVGAYVLNFNGRVTRASVKNFQLYNPSKDPDAVIMQFGRVGKDAFTMDYQHPLCALQAFGIALSSFDYKIACE